VGLMEPLASSSSSVELDKASCGSQSPAPGQQGCPLQHHRNSKGGQTNLGGVGDLLLADLRDELLLALQQLASERNAQVRQVGLARR